MGSLTSEPELDPNSQKAKEISGKSPLRIALGRLSRDKIAMVCAFVVLFFVFCAVFAGPICALFGVSLETPLASERVDGLNNGLPKPEYGPPNGSFTWDHPMGVAPRTGEDNLAYWLYGCRVSLTIATTATVVASTLGVVVGLLAGFIDSIAGGQNQLQNDADNGGNNPTNDGWAGKYAGFMFDAGFEADYMLILRNGNAGGDRFDIDYAVIGGGASAFEAAGNVFGGSLEGANASALPMARPVARPTPAPTHGR